MKNLLEKILLCILIGIVISLLRNTESYQKLGGKFEQIIPSVSEHSMERLLLLAKEPLGKTMYVWGGGWNAEDTGAGEECRKLGRSPRWEEFTLMQDETYDFKNTRYQIHDGLDCSGYLGWVIYNLLETKNGEDGYVVKATEMSQFLAKKGLGEYTQSIKVQDWKPGDIMSMKGHVWMSLGTCKDGSVVVLHSSPPGVTISGTLLPNGQESLATKLAQKYMKKYYPQWYKKYGVKACEYTYLTDSDRMRWDVQKIKDFYGLQQKTAKEVLEWMF